MLLVVIVEARKFKEALIDNTEKYNELF